MTVIPASRPQPVKDQRFDALPGIPGRDDPELTMLMEAVRRLPRDGADNCVESLLRCALGYERSGDVLFLDHLSRSALMTFRCRRNPADQAALDAPPPRPGPFQAKGALDLGDVFAELGGIFTGSDAGGAR